MYVGWLNFLVSHIICHKIFWLNFAMRNPLLIPFNNYISFTSIYVIEKEKSFLHLRGWHANFLLSIDSFMPFNMPRFTKRIIMTYLRGFEPLTSVNYKWYITTKPTNNFLLTYIIITRELTILVQEKIKNSGI